MDCKECKLEMVNLFDSDVNQTTLTRLKEHLLQCPECATDYRETIEMLAILKPRLLPGTPFLLKQNIINQLKLEESKMKSKTSKVIRISTKVKKIFTIAAMLAIIMMIIPFVSKNDGLVSSTARAAECFIKNSIKATGLIKSMVIKLQVRTVAHDNFSFVGTEYNMVDHTIWKTFENPVKWRVDKGERVVVFDGKDQYLWLPKFEEGIKAGAEANFTEWLKILLDPEAILIKEQTATKDKGSKFTMDEKSGKLLMTITSKARGNYINDYCKNSSIEESDNRREYTFDSNSKLLKGLKIYILEGKKETLILNIEKIDYNLPIDSSLFAIVLPKGAQWKVLNDNYRSDTFKNISCRHAAELFFGGLANNDWKLVEEACDFFKNPSEKVHKIKNYFGGLTIIKIGEPFKSGLYPGEFVPYEIKFKSGETKKFNLALRNDNPNKVWVVDGGF